MGSPSPVQLKINDNNETLETPRSNKKKKKKSKDIESSEYKHITSTYQERYTVNRGKDKGPQVPQAVIVEHLELAPLQTQLALFEVY